MSERKVYQDAAACRRPAESSGLHRLGQQKASLDQCLANGRIFGGKGSETAPFPPKSHRTAPDSSESSFAYSGNATWPSTLKLPLTPGASVSGCQPPTRTLYSPPAMIGSPISVTIPRSRFFNVK